MALNIEILYPFPASWSPAVQLPDQRGWISDCRQALRFDKERHIVGELGEVGLHVVLQDQPGQRPRGIVLPRHLGEDVDEIIVKVWILV